jgi:hypothetical protein
VHEAGLAARTIGNGALVAALPVSLATTGCYAIAEAGAGFGALVVLAIALGLPLAALVITALLALAPAPRTLRVLLAVPAIAVLALASGFLATELVSGAVPLPTQGFRIALGALFLAMVPVAAARGAARLYAAALMAVWVALLAAAIVSLRPGSRVPELPLADVALGTRTLCGLFHDRTVVCMGDNRLGQCGVGHVGSTRGWALPVPLRPTVALRGFGDDFCVLDVTDAVVCWGASFGATPVEVGAGDASLAVGPAGLVSVRGADGALRALHGDLASVADSRADASIRAFGERCVLSQAGVRCGERSVPLPGSVAHLRGDGRMVCAAVVGGGVLCWGSSAWIRLHGAFRRGDPAMESMIGPQLSWDAPSPIQWP